LSTEDYLQRMEALGVGRGALASGAQFPISDRPLGNGAMSHEPELVNEAAGLKVSRESLGLPVEDLSFLNPPRSRNQGSRDSRPTGKEGGQA